jgi:signal transduction histidine kinase
MRALLIVLLLTATAALTSAVAAPLPRAVLIIDESDPSSGAPTIFSATLRATLSNVKPSVAVFGETLDLSRFSGPKQEAILRTYIQQKYSDVGFGVVLAVGASAFDLVRRWRSELWPDAPIVFAAIDEMTAAELKPDSNTTGLIMQRTIKSMMTSARVLVPDLQGVAVLGGSLSRDPYRLQYLLELPKLAAETKLINLTGLPLAEQMARAAELPDKTAILYTSLFIDDEGTRYSAADALTAIAKVANRPIVVDVESLVGFGATGGLVLDNVAYGREVAGLAIRILDGASVAANPIAVSEYTRPVFDSRQLQKWHIGESNLPAGSEIRFRPQSMWEQFATQILAACAVFIVQIALIGWLIYEHRRRHLAEVQARNSMTELTQLNRLATAGELSAAIAHEIKQPISGMVAMANAAVRWLSRESPDIGRARDAMNKVVAAGHHASDIITNIRGVFGKDTQENTLCDVNQLIRTVLSLVYIDLRKHSIEARVNLSEQLPLVIGNKVQLQQVILNLVMNAVEAMVSAAEPRVLSITSEINEHNDVLVSIADTGSGIDVANLSRIFKPMFTTKARGMGMGLSICKSIIESHNGRIWVSVSVPRGSIFHFELPSQRDADGKINLSEPAPARRGGTPASAVSAPSLVDDVIE